jgi:cytochrome b6-f complex iron-sulfur subunit
MAEKKKLSVEEILALARKKDGTKGGAESPSVPSEQPAPAAAPADVPEAAQKPPTPPKAKAPPASGGRPSVADILAMARSGGAKPAAASQAPEAASAPPKPAPKPAAKEPKAAPAPAVSGAKDTASILAAARNPARPGPISKFELAEKSAPAPAATPAKPSKVKPTVPPMPAKPQYAKAKGDEAEDRRDFISMALGTFLGLGFTSLGLTGGLWTLLGARFMFPNTLMEPPSTFKVGPAANFPLGYVENKFKAQYGVWIVHADYQGQAQLFALSTVCTHLGCTPNWLEAEQKFKCPCHGSGFYKDGINFEGPAPRPLERYAIRVADDGQLEVDKSRKFQEELGGWADPNSFVPA